MEGLRFRNEDNTRFNLQRSETVYASRYMNSLPNEYTKEAYKVELYINHNVRIGEYQNLFAHHIIHFEVDVEIIMRTHRIAGFRL